MRIIKKTRLKDYWTAYPKAKSPLEHWHDVTAKAIWKKFDDVKRTFSSTDCVQVKSGRKVVVFNIGGNNYRLISAIHYRYTKIVYVLRFMTHKEYDSNKWKEEL